MSELTHENIRFVPIAHRRVAFAEQVRRAAMEWRPDCIAVELPASLAAPMFEGIARLPRLSVVTWGESDQPGDLYVLPIDPCDGLIEACRLALDHGLALDLIDADLPHLSEPPRYLPDGEMIPRIGFETYVRNTAPAVRNRPDDAAAALREGRMAARLADLAQRHHRVLCVLGLGHYEAVRERLAAKRFAVPAELAQHEIHERPTARLAHMHRRSLVDLLGEIPYVTHLYETSRAEQELTGEAGFDKFRAIHTLFKQAEARYEETYKESVNVTQRRALLQYTRNLAITRGGLAPDFYEIVVGARGCVDGDYGYEVFELARSYPGQKREPHEDLPTFKSRGPRGALSDREERYRVRLRQERERGDSVWLRFRRRPPSRETKDRWRAQWALAHMLGLDGMCSWPPEDDRQERFMDFLRKRAMQIVGEDRRQVREFTSTLMDGLDLRETTRNWHTGKLYVHQTPQPRGRVGGVVVIFRDEPMEMDGASWRSTWYAEHQNESDIAFFSEPPGNNVVGPRISRTEFNGILSIYPAQHIPDLWTAIRTDAFKHASEMLLAGAIFFTPDRYIAYVAGKPPGALIRELAEQEKKHIIYMPIHMFSQRRMKKVRTFHILGGHDVRAYARDYIFEDE